LASIYSLLVLLRYTELFFVLIYTHKAFSFIDRCLYILFFSYTSYFLVFVFFTILNFSLHTLYLEFVFESKLILQYNWINSKPNSVYFSLFVIRKRKERNKFDPLKEFIFLTFNTKSCIICLFFLLSCSRKNYILYNKNNNSSDKLVNEVQIEEKIVVLVYNEKKRRGRKKTETINNYKNKYDIN